MYFERRYLFQGHAVAAAAHIRRYKDEPVHIETCFEGSAALPETGGCLFSKSPKREIIHPQFGFILSFESASAAVNGDFIDTAAAIAQTHGQLTHYRSPVRVTAEASLQTLNVQNKLTADFLSAKLVSDDARNHGQTRFSAPQLPRYEGVKIDGFPIELEIDPVLLQAATKQTILDEYRHDTAFRTAYKDRFYRTGCSTHSDDTVPEIKGYLVASIVKKITFPHGVARGVTIEGNKLTLPGFGRIYFGEILIGEATRSLSLIRLQMGSDWGGDASFVTTKPNGTDGP